MITPRLLVGAFALGACSIADAWNLFARDCSFTWPAYEGETCKSMANNWSISEADFISYNSGVNCAALEVGKEYCVEWSGTPPNQPPAPTPTPSKTPTPSSTPTSSKPSTPVVSSIRTTLSTITSPPITSSSTSPTPTSAVCPSTPAGVTTPSPVQTGLVCGCTKFYQVVTGDGCWAIANANGITLEDFYAWNPASANDCKTLIPGAYVCIARGGATSTPRPSSTGPFVPIPCTWDAKLGQYICPTAPPTSQRTTSTPRPTTTSTIRNPPPGPTQAGIPSNCNQWVLQKDGVYCYDMAQAAKITLERLYALNPALNGDCSGLWPGYAYCIGTS